MVSERRDPGCPKYSECLSEAAHTKVLFSCKICKEKGFKSPVKKKEVPMKTSEPAVRSEVEFPPDPEKHVCRYCGGEFEPKRADSQTDVCYRHACRTKWYGEKRKERRLNLKPVSKLKRKKVQGVAGQFSSGPPAQAASPEEILRMLEKGVVLKVIALLKKEFGV